MTMKILFPTTMKYNNTVYEGGKVYEVSEENGFANRWLRRGCKIVEGESSVPQEVPEVKTDKSSKKSKRKGAVDESEETDL
jgi:hypothetical protein